jgi:hypothetical protein
MQINADYKGRDFRFVEETEPPIIMVVDTVKLGNSPE